jgi:hypothetical protein
MKSFLGLIFLGIAACSGPEKSVRAEPTPKPILAKPAEDRVSACLVAMDSESAKVTVMACREMWRDTACQDAWAASLEVLRGDRARVILRGCLPAYCDERIPICSWDVSTADLTDVEPDWLEGWAELNRQILPQDLDGAIEAPEAGEFAKQLLILVTLQR